MGKFTQVQTEYAIKDHLPKGASRITAQVIVGTPGTMTDLMRRKVIDPSEVKVFVLDEADNMLGQDGLGDQTLRVKNMLPRTHPVQIILFSATFPDHVRAFASKFAPNANKIELQQNELSVDGIRQFYMDCKNEEHKYDILVSLYGLLTVGQSIIFCKVTFDAHLPRCSAFLTRDLASTNRRQNITTHDSRGAQGRLLARCQGCC